MAETALITGASSGIGEEFARQLAERGYEVILVARREDRLKELAEQLPTKATVIACDLAGEADKLAAEVERRRLQVELLVNNAGFGLRGRFAELDTARQAQMVRVNCEAIVHLTGAFLPPMIARGSGGVITVASTAGMQPLPYEAVYAASKAFALNLTDALNTELKGTGVRAMSVNPGPVPTEWQAVAGYEGGVPPKTVPGHIDAPQVVRESLRAYDRGRRSMIPGFVIRNFIRLTKPSPRGMQLRVAERMYRPPS
jgi:short-subunit dehydrogenase